MGLDPTAIVDVSTYTASIPKPEVGTEILAEDVTAIAQALANRTAQLHGHKVDVIGGTLVSGTATDLTMEGTCIVDSTATLEVDGTFLLLAGGTVQAGIFQVSTELKVPLGGSVVLQTGSLLDARATVIQEGIVKPADAATINVDASAGYRYVKLATPGSPPRTVKLLDASTAFNLQTNQVIRVIAPPGLADGDNFHVIAETASVSLANLHGYTVTQSASPVNGSTWADFYWTGSVWAGLSASGYVTLGAGW
jgi:hypothetical protein